MDKVTIRLSNTEAKSRACHIIAQAPTGHVAVIREETRSDRQNRLMWPLIRDLREQLSWMGEHTPDDVKLQLLNLLSSEMRMLERLDGGGFFPVGQRSSLLTKSQFSDLLEIIFKYGAENGVSWSHRSYEAFREGGYAQAIETRERQDAKSGLARKGESAVRKDAP